MKVLVATDGHLDPEATGALVSRISGDGGEVTVLTVIDHPGDVLRNFADVGGVKGIDELLSDTGPGQLGFGSGSASAERLRQRVQVPRGSDLPLDKYFTDTADRLQRPLVEHFQASGIDFDALWRPTERKTARTILDSADNLSSDVLVIGSHGGGRFEGMLGSTVTKIVRLAPIPVLLVK